VIAVVTRADEGRLTRGRDHQQREPPVQILVAEHGHRMSERFDLALQAESPHC
jgi:hypothetical protein